MAESKNADVSVSNHGTLFLFQPLTEAGTEWIENNVSDESTFMGTALVVEHRFARDLAEGMKNDGLILE